MEMSRGFIPSIFPYFPLFIQKNIKFIDSKNEKHQNWRVLIIETIVIFCIRKEAKFYQG